MNQPGSNSSPAGEWERLRPLLDNAMDGLSARDREVLVLRYLEQLSPREGAAALGISETSFMKRHVRAIQRLRRILDGKAGGYEKVEGGQR